MEYNLKQFAFWHKNTNLINRSFNLSKSPPLQIPECGICVNDIDLDNLILVFPFDDKLTLPLLDILVS